MNWNPLSRANATSKSALMFVATMAASTGLVVGGYLDGAAWVSLWTVALPIFLGTEAYRKAKEPKPTTTTTSEE